MNGEVVFTDNDIEWDLNLEETRLIDKYFVGKFGHHTY